MLKRVPTASELGSWSYEVIDTKLAAETRAGTILQLALYTELLTAAQGHRPEHFYVVTPEGNLNVTAYRVLDYLAYYRLVRTALERSVKRDPSASSDTYPEPVPNCDVCRWWQNCMSQWRADDHLSLVAGISRLHRADVGNLRPSLLSKGSLPYPSPPLLARARGSTASGLAYPAAGSCSARRPTAQSPNSRAPANHSWG